MISTEQGMLQCAISLLDSKGRMMVRQHKQRLSESEVVQLLAEALNFPIVLSKQAVRIVVDVSLPDCTAN